MNRTAELPFERGFRRWVGERAYGWEQLTVSLGHNGDYTTAYRFTPENPTRTVFALHGAGNDALFAWIGLFKTLLLRQTEVFTFDLPGHGRSNKTRFSSEGARQAVESLLDECVRGDPTLPVHAVGVSLGGSVLLSTLPTVQERLASAALVVAPFEIDCSRRSLLSELGWGTVSLLWRERHHYGCTGLIPSFGPFKRDIYPLRLARSAPPGTFGYVETLNQALAEMDLGSAAASVRLPVLLIYGCRDRIVPLEQGEHLARAMSSAELLAVPTGTHLSTPLDPLAIERFLSWIDRHP